MEVFNLTLTQMLMMFTLILLGFVLRKKAIVPENTGSTLAKLETFIFTPFLTLSTQMARCTVKTFTENAPLILYGTVIVICAIIVSYPLSRLFVRKADNFEDSYRRNIYKYALVFGNYGFMGNFIILGIWGEEMFFRYMLFNLVISIFCNGWGMYVLIPRDKNTNLAQHIKKALLTPPILALALGIVFGLLDLAKFMPEFLLNAFDSAGKCQGPVAMVLAGAVIGGYNFKELLTNKKVYWVTLLRLVVIPAVIMLILEAFGTPKDIMTLALITFATPLGLNTIVYPAAFGGETKTGASMTMISHTLSVITIPLMYLIFIVLL